jgi:hypothetical protein
MQDWPTTFKYVFTSVAICLVLASTCAGSVPLIKRVAALEELREWLQHTGKSSVLRAHIVDALNLPAHDMRVLERGFRHEGDRITHVCSVSAVAGLEDLLFFAQVEESTGNALIWRTNLTGGLVGTARFSNGVTERVSNDQYAALFNTEKTLFLTRMRMQPAASPTPAK